MVRLQDVADEVGVSKMTVSNVLNGHADRVAAATYERVLRAADRLGYVPNAQARSLSARRSRIISFVFSPPADPRGHGLANPHDAAFVGELERQLTDHGLTLMVRTHSEVARTSDYLRSWNADGAIMLHSYGDEVLPLLDAYDKPVVFVDNYGTSPRIHSVGIDDHLGGYLAGQRLAAAGHTEVGFAGPPLTPDGVVARRYQGFVNALAERGIRLDPRNVVEWVAEYEAGLGLGRWLAGPGSRCTGWFVTADILAVGALNELSRHGVRVPEDISLTGFDDSPISHQCAPELTTVHQDIRAKVRVATEVLLDLIARWPDVEPHRITLGVSLVDRETVGPPPPRVPR